MTCVRMMGFGLLFAMAANVGAVTRLEDIPFEKIHAQCCLKDNSSVFLGVSMEKNEKGQYIFRYEPTLTSDPLGDRTLWSFEATGKEGISGDTPLDDALKLCLKDKLEHAWTIALIV